jgi:AcrR family transcriptional regulator
MHETMNSAGHTARARLSRPNDARALRSREALRDALLTLIQQKPLEQVSIRDITNAAGVSYPVFFRRYASKDELLEDVATAEVRALLALTTPIFNATTQDESLRALCGYVNEHRPIWTGLLTGGAASAMQQEFKRIALETGETRQPANPWLPPDLAATFVVTGIFEILAWWLNQPADYPVQNVVTILDTLIVRSTARPIDVKLIDWPPGLS